MQTAVCGAFANLHISSRPRAQLSFKTSISPGNMLVLPRQGLARSPVVYLVEAKQNSLRRQRTSEKARQRNRARNSEVKTSIKKVLKAVDAATADPPEAESDLVTLGSLMSQAYKVIDQAASKGVLHKNTAARRKARLARVRQNLLIAAGLYTPQAELAAAEEAAQDPPGEPAPPLLP